MRGTKGKVVGINGNMVSVEFDGLVTLNEVGYVHIGDTKLKSEIIRIRGSVAQMQVFEITKGIRVGDEVEFTGDLLSVELGPGLLGRVYDGLQNPLPDLAEKAGYFLERGIYLNALPTEAQWDFTPVAQVGDTLVRGDVLGTVPEGNFTHRIMLPFGMYGTYTLSSIKPAGQYTVHETIAEVTDERGKKYPLTMSFRWPVKRAIDCYAERLKPSETLVTKIRTVDTFFPVAKGGTYCIPGPFGAGKTVLQHATSRNAEVDIVIIAACGERAGIVRLKDGSKGSVTIGGTVSPAGGNFEEPVTQATLKVVGAFHGLSRERSDARKYPAIHPLDSWSKYPSVLGTAQVEYGRGMLRRGTEVEQMMKVVGEEGTSMEDFIVYLKGDFLDAVYLQQNSFDKVDDAVSVERQRYIYKLILRILGSQFSFNTKDEARAYFNKLRQSFIDYNYSPWESPEFKKHEAAITGALSDKATGLDEKAAKLIKEAEARHEESVQ